MSVPCILGGKDLQEFRLTLGNEIADKISVIAKIDTTEALKQFDNILANTDCVLIQRDDLGLELDPEKLVLA